MMIGLLDVYGFKWCIEEYIQKYITLPLYYNYL